MIKGIQCIYPNFKIVNLVACPAVYHCIAIVLRGVLRIYKIASDILQFRKQPIQHNLVFKLKEYANKIAVVAVGNCEWNELADCLNELES
jgi:hypothetical protein